MKKLFIIILLIQSSLFASDYVMSYKEFKEECKENYVAVESFSPSNLTRYEAFESAKVNAMTELTQMIYDSVVQNKTTMNKTALNNTEYNKEFTLQSIISIQGSISLKYLKKEFIPKTYYAKGNYFSVNKNFGIRHLVYPIPEGFGLGIHLTLELDNSIKFGPDVEWVDTPDDYQVNTDRKQYFIKEIHKYFRLFTKDIIFFYCQFFFQWGVIYF